MTRNDQTKTTRPDPNDALTVRYVHRMGPHRTVPLILHWNPEALAAWLADRHPDLAATTPDWHREPLVAIAHFPGCHVQPAHRALHPHQPAATVHITPLAAGPIRDARLELNYRGRPIASLALPARVHRRPVLRLLLLTGPAVALAWPLLHDSGWAQVLRILEPAPILVQILHTLGQSGIAALLGLAGLIALIRAHIASQPRSATQTLQ